MLVQIIEGIWYLDEPEIKYDSSYFNKYQLYEETELGINLTKERVKLVKKTNGLILDVGIGSGHFIKECIKEGLKINGIDVNPLGIRFLENNNINYNPDYNYDVLTFWDSFEHIKNPCNLMNHKPKTILMSLPIFMNRQHITESKHYKPGEHYWYFTEFGLLKLLQFYGYKCNDINDIESILGREDILTFEFELIK